MRQALALLVAVLTIHAFAQTNKLVVHEWGTFTSLQDDTGRALPGINADDEPLPNFVESIPINYEVASKFSKAVPRLHPQVTMRLETPVVYFYPPADAKLPMTVTFSAKFNGGLLTQFFPKAQVSEMSRTSKQIVRVDPNGAGTLTWKDIKIGVMGKMMETNERVWTAPRETQSAMITTQDGTGEKFLFYRGVGNLDSPVKVLHDGGKFFVRATSDRSEYQPDAESMFLVQIREDGSCAFHQFHQGDGIGLKLNEATADHFAGADFSSNLNRLRSAMQTSLVQAGLKADEAMAMLNTWQQSYFKSPGMRLFFVVPPAWTNTVLPITVSEPVEITRVMVGRIELITPEQRSSIATIAGAKDVKAKSVSDAYANLGRFRDALLLDAAKKTPELAAFLKSRGIQFADMGDQPVAMRSDPGH